MWGAIRRSLATTADLLLPPVCHLCDQALPAQLDLPGFCLSCLADFPPLSPARCSRCACPFVGTSEDRHLCGSCLQIPPAFSHVYALGQHDGALCEAINRVKYRNRLDLATLLGKLLAEDLTDQGLGQWPDLLLPVPLQRKRLRSRGYNQAAELARPIAKILQRPLMTDWLRRTRHTPPQQGLNAEQRRLNQRDSFICSGSIANQKILLIDDVMTTGETARECSRVLQDAGATEIRVAVVTRA
ncbi:MAG: ComF family protein [Desulfuromonadales bacterium]|nr:ComF family protein [Desulfuromonadales bacterium]